jgi:hypothetical protein
MIQLLGFQPGYMPGDELKCHVHLNEITPNSITAIETSIAWYTEGKGNEDLGVHFFQRLAGETLHERDWSKPLLIESILPESPLSYEGRLLKIRWCIRVRAYLVDGSELVAQEPFYLGTDTKEI